MDDNLFKENLKEIFPDLSDIKLNMLSVKIITNISNKLNKEMAQDFIERLVKGEIDKIDRVKGGITISEYVSAENIEMTNIQQKKMYHLIHQYIMSKFSLAELYTYIENTFPLWSALKRLLLEKRRGTNKLQWEYIETKYHKKGYSDIFSNVSNYKMLYNYDAANAISTLTDHETIDNQFMNTIRGWFRDKDLRNTPMHHEVSSEVLYRLAYAFNITTDEFDKLCTGSVNGVWNPYDFSENLYRFGLNFRLPYKYIANKAEENKDITKTDMPLYSPDETITQIERFFDEHEEFESSEELTDEYISFLSRIGAICTEKAIQNVRTENSRIYANELLNKTNISNIKRYYESRYISVEDIIEERYSDYTISMNQQIFINNTREKIEDIKEKYSDTEKLLKAKSKILSCICDGSKPKKKGIGADAFGKTSVLDIMNGKTEIRRNDILRLGYLSTLIDYINENITEDELIQTFESTTDRMLNQCRFHKLHITLPVDALMYLSLSSSDRCIPEVFQTFIPGKTE